MITLFDHLKDLYDECLYSNVVTLAPMLISMSDNNHFDHVTPLETFQTYYYYGDSLFHEQLYRKAESMFRRALQLRKSVLKPRGSIKPHDGNKEILPESEIKYKMHLCYLHMNQHQDAIDILQSIPAKQRSIKVNMCLAKALEKGGLMKQAVNSYKEVLKYQPLAMEVAEKLLSLKVPAASVIDIISNGLSELPAWGVTGGMATWITAMGYVRTKQWNAAIQSLRSMDTPGSLLRNCPNLLITLGEVLYHSGEYKQAIVSFQRAHTTDPHMLRGLESYAACLSRDNRLLENADHLISTTLPLPEYTIHHWLTLAHIHVERRRLPLAAYLAQKACIAEPRNPEALLLKGNILMSLKKYSEALEHFREAMEVAPDRYESYAGLAEALIAVRRSPEAIYVALDCCKKFSHSPRALTLYANILLKGEAGAQSKVKHLLKKAISVDNKYLPASLALARLIDTEDESQSDINLLENQVSDFPSSALHQALGEIWARKGGPVGTEQAAHHYGAALALDPGNRRALDALARLDRTPATQGQASDSVPGNPEQGVEDADNTYELVAEPNVPSDNSNAPEESETEAVWSDMDLEIT